jgi:hypothetical protein
MLSPIVLAWFALALVRCSGDDAQGTRPEPDAAQDAFEATVDVTLAPPDGGPDELGGDTLPPDTLLPDTLLPDTLLPDTADEAGPDACARECGGRECGDDGCQGSCGGCGVDQICSDLGHCVSAPTCTEVTKIGCCEGGVLWACESGVVVPTTCPAAGGCGWLEGEGAYGCGGGGAVGPHGSFPLDCPWVCHPACEGVECGADGCGGSCGACPAGQNCDSHGACCAPQCETADGTVRECGSDGCGGSCGTCGPGGVCGGEGTCASPCAHACTGRECGPDGCGGTCGACEADLVCTEAGQCVVTCAPTCGARKCGSDGCGGSCGSCATGTFCQADGTCGSECVPQCGARECGDDGCGGVCGECAADVLCTLEGACGSTCASCGYEPECLAFGFESGNLLGWSTVAEPLVLKSLGATPAPEGAYLLDLDTAGDDGANDAATIQTCAPTGALTLHFVWRLYSEEFKEFCGTQYDDYFRVTVGHADGHDIVFERTVDDLCPKSACPETCGAFEVPLTAADVAFDQGDAWATPWMVANLPLAGVLPSGGGLLSLTFEAGDAGDSIYDTHILVDEILLVQGCSPECAEVADGAAACGSDGCGGLCGVCPYGAPCGADGLCEGCEPQCDGKACGPDGCGGACGECAAGSTCQVSDGTCVSAPGGLGAPCASPEDCPDDLHCLASGGGFPPSGDLVCTLACEFNLPGGATTCPEGWTCFPNLTGEPTAYCIEGTFPG